MTDDLEAAWHIVQHLGHVLTELRHARTAIGARACAIGFRLVDDLLSRQVVRQRLALRLHARADRFRPIFRRGVCTIFSLAGLQFFELQLQLLDLAGDPLR